MHISKHIYFPTVYLLCCKGWLCIILAI